MEPSLALTSLEAALRQTVTTVLGENKWIIAKGAPEKKRLEAKREEEAKKRDGTIISQNLIEYTETYHLTEIIKKNWENFHPVFDDQKRTLAYFGVLMDIRNTIAHSRELVSYERQLISGISGHLRNQIAIYRSSLMDASKYYPVIESVRDNFGRLGGQSEMDDHHKKVRVDVGTVVEFYGTAVPARGKDVLWFPATNETYLGFDVPIQETEGVVRGESATLTYTFTEDDVGEWTKVSVFMGGDSKYHNGLGYDDVSEFIFAVNPPAE